MSKKAKPHPNAVSSESRNKMNELAPQAGFYPARDVGGDPCDRGEKVIPSQDLIVFGQAAVTSKESKNNFENNFEAKVQIAIRETFVEENNRTRNQPKVYQKLLLHPKHQQISDKDAKIQSDNHTHLSQAISKVYGDANSDSDLKLQKRPQNLGRYIGGNNDFTSWPVNHKQSYTPGKGHWPVQVLLEIGQKLREGLLLWNVKYAELGEGLNLGQHLIILSVTEQVSKTTPTVKIGPSPRNTKEGNHLKKAKVPHSEHEHRMKEVKEFEYWAKKNKTAEESDTARHIRYDLEAKDKLVEAHKSGEIPSLEECLEQTSSERSRKIIWPGRRPRRSD